MNEIFKKIKSSFKASIKGEESITTLIRWWGIPAYLITFFVISRIILAYDQRFVDVTISLLTAVYFIWHIFALKKCSPKKPKLTKEEKALLKREARKNFGKKVLKKLLLQESLTKWDPVIVTMVIDIIFITQFLGYIFG
jgi:hypothetical protein